MGIIAHIPFLREDHMKKILLIITVCISNLGYSSTIKYKGSDYDIARVEDKYLVYKPRYSVKLEDIGDLTPVDCKTINRELKRKYRRIKSCTNNPEKRGCDDLVKSLKNLSHEAIHQVPPTPYSQKRGWELTFDFNPSYEEKANLKRFVSRNKDILVDDISVHVASKLMVKEDSSIMYSSDSLTKKVMSLMEAVGRQKLDHPSIEMGLLKVDNRYFACDVEEGKVRLESSFVQNLSHTENIKESVLLSIWGVYNNIKNFIKTNDVENEKRFIKAALVGYELGKSLEKEKFDKRKYDIKNIFSAIFDVSMGDLALEEFRSHQELKNKKYPERRYTKDVSILWSTK